MIRYRGFASVLPNDELPYGDFVRERKHDLLKVKGDPFRLVVFQQVLGESDRDRNGDPTKRQQEDFGYEKDEQELDYPVTSLVERKIAFVGFHLRSLMSNLPSGGRECFGFDDKPELVYYANRQIESYALVLGSTIPGRRSFAFAKMKFGFCN